MTGENVESTTRKREPEEEAPFAWADLPVRAFFFSDAPDSNGATAMNLNRDLLRDNDPAIYEALVGEEKRQQAGIELIPSENYTYPEVLAVLGSIFTNKYSEGYPGRRYYGGQRFTDVIENVARDRAKQLFRAEHVNVQPLSGSPMNQAVYMAFLQPGDTVLVWTSPMAGI